MIHVEMVCQWHMSYKYRGLLNTPPRVGETYGSPEDSGQKFSPLISSHPHHLSLPISSHSPSALTPHQLSPSISSHSPSVLTPISSHSPPPLTPHHLSLPISSFWGSVFLPSMFSSSCLFLGPHIQHHSQSAQLSLWKMRCSVHKGEGNHLALLPPPSLHTVS